MSQTDPQVRLEINGRYGVGSITFPERASLEATRALDGVVLTIPTMIEVRDDGDPEAVNGRPLLMNLAAIVKWQGAYLGTGTDKYLYWGNYNPQPGHLQVHLLANVVHRIERGRDGGDLVLDLEVRADLHVATPLDRLTVEVEVAGKQVQGSVAGGNFDGYLAPPQPVSGTPRVTYPATAWADVLNKTGLGENVVVEVPLPLAPRSKQWMEVWEHLRRARDALAQGGSTNWGQVVIESRKALELWRDIQPPAVGQDVDKKVREARGANERFDVLRRYLHEYAHLAAHPSGLTATRDDAVLVLSGLAALLAKRSP